MTSTIVFPAHDVGDGKSTHSVLSRQTTALEICDIVYGNSNPSWEAIEHCYESSAIYENPFVTATSREILTDISSLTRRLSQCDIPTPVTLLSTLLGLQHSEKNNKPWFRALEVWTEVDEILESDSFDGHRRTIVEHTLNILLLPDLHSSEAANPHGINQVDTLEQYPQLPTLAASSASLRRSVEPIFAIAGIGLPSPLHFQLPIVTRLSLNEQGRIIHHRDFWDVKDILSLMPGATVTQWISTRLAGYSLAAVSRICGRILGKREVEGEWSESLGCDRSTARRVV